ncbi:MAG: hypothetical protein ABUL71_05420 [Gemmatimonadota bacterium]
MDPAADPWGVRRAENLLTSLEGILSARVVTTPLGEVSEIHILASGGQNAKQVVRNVESALLAHLGLKVDHRKISVAASAEVKPLQALEMGAVRDRAAQRVVLFEDLAMATVPRSRRVTATVTLALDGQVESVTEEGPDTQRNRMEVAARAAVMAMCQLFGVNALALEGVQQAEMFGRSVVVVGVLAASSRDSRLLMGTAEVRESVEHASVYAVLDATNRWAVAHKPR